VNHPYAQILKAGSIPVSAAIPINVLPYQRDKNAFDGLLISVFYFRRQHREHTDRPSRPVCELDRSRDQVRAPFWQ
jgi:hypothetical protein